jgi:hypothetical protein
MVGCEKEWMHMVRAQAVNPSQYDNFFVGPLRTLVLIGAVAAILGGLLLISGDLLGLVVGKSDDTYSNSPIEKVMAVLFLAGKVLVLIGLVGLYLRQANSAGRFGLVSFLIALAGTGLMVASDWSEVFIAPILHQVAPDLVETNTPALLIVGFVLNFVTETLGWLLFGIATFRARVLPRPAALLLAAGPLIPFIGPSWSYVFLNAAIVWLGVAVMRSLARAPSIQTVGGEVLERA